MLLEDRVALVTGASRGIGRAIATTFAAEGASLVICSRTEAIETAAADIRYGGGRVTAVRGDLGDEAFTRDLIARCRKEHGRLDVLVNNAGILSPGLLGMVPSKTVREMFEVNVFALMSLTQVAVRIMDATRAPSIVHLASIAGTRGLEGLTAYSATKGAVAAFTRASAKELAPRGIRVNAIAPGIVDTGMAAGAPDDWTRRNLAGIAMGRPGRPEEVASVALFLASPLSGYVTGQVIGVDGGMAA